MGKYGDAAIKAVKLFASGTADSPEEAWEIATSEIFRIGTTSQEKACPRNAFLGLCEDGLVKNIPSGDYTKSEKNKQYAIKAVKILQDTPELESNKHSLWNEVIGTKKKKENQQMDVVISLWRNNLIVKTNLVESLFQISEQDLKAAKCLFDKGLYPQAVFYLQQSVEKANKSWAITYDIIEEEEVKTIRHDPFKFYIKMLVKQKEKFKSIIGNIKKFPKLEETKLVRDLNLEKYYESASEIQTTIEKYYKIKGNSVSDIKSKGIKEIGELIYIDENIIRSLIKYLDYIELEDWSQKPVEISPKEIIEIRVDVIQFLEAISSDNKEIERFKAEVDAICTPNLMVELIKEIISFPISDYVYVTHSLYNLSLLMIPHSIITRYPENDYNPLTIYNKNLPLIQLFSDLIGIMENTLSKLKKLLEVEKA